MAIYATLLVGLLVGVAARFLMPGRDPGGIVVTMLLGVAGAFLAAFAGHTAGWYASGDPAGLIGSVAGAFALLLLYRLTLDRRRRS